MKILISAYTCEPGRGSEPEVGWHWAREIARHHEVWVITRSNNRDVIESGLVRSPDPSMNLVYVDLPRWAQFWKRGQRGVRHYYLWQFIALRRAQVVHKTVRFDLVHHFEPHPVLLRIRRCSTIIMDANKERATHRDHTPSLEGSRPRSRILDHRVHRSLPAHYVRLMSCKACVLLWSGRVGPAHCSVLRGST